MGVKEIPYQEAYTKGLNMARTTVTQSHLLVHILGWKGWWHGILLLHNLWWFVVVSFPKENSPSPARCGHVMVSVDCWPSNTCNCSVRRLLASPSHCSLACQPLHTHESSVWLHAYTVLWGIWVLLSTQFHHPDCRMSIKLWTYVSYIKKWMHCVASKPYSV